MWFITMVLAAASVDRSANMYHAYVAVPNRAGHGVVDLVNTSTNKIAKAIQVSGLNPTYIAMQPSSSFVWVAVNYEFMVINTSTNSVVAKISGLGTPLEGIAFSPSGKTAYLTYGQGKIAVVNTSTRKVIATIQVPGNYSGPSG